MHGNTVVSRHMKPSINSDNLLMYPQKKMKILGKAVIQTDTDLDNSLRELSLRTKVTGDGRKMNLERVIIRKRTSWESLIGEGVEGRPGRGRSKK